MPNSNKPNTKHIKEVAEHPKDVNLQYYFSNEINVKKIFLKICNGEDDQKLFISIGKNLVKPDDVILRSLNKQETLKAGQNVKFDKNSGIYRSEVFGYVYYENNAFIEIYPIVYILKDSWKAVLILPPQKDIENPVLVDKVQEILITLPIKLMVNYETISHLIQKTISENLGGMTTFVEGRKPVNGRVQKVILDYDFSVAVGKETVNGKMDFKERKFVNNVDENESIAHYEPEIIPIDGQDIYDAIIKADFDKDPGYKLGKNVKIADDSIHILSSLNGIISASNNVLSVHDVVEVNTVDLSTGNLEVLGTAIIRENVSDGFSVKTKGDIIVYGNVENANLEAEGNIMISGGLVGGKAFANGSIYSSFIANADLNCYGDVIASKSILNSNINSNARVICLKEKGIIIGGNISAKNGVYVKVVGGTSGTHTTIYVGKDIEINQRYKELVETIKENKETIKKIKSTLGSDYFINPKVFLSKLPPNKVESVKSTLKVFANVLKETNDCENERHEIQKTLEELSHAIVSITDKIFSGTTIHIVNMKRTIDREIAGTGFYYSKEYDMILEKVPTILDLKEYDFVIEEKSADD